MQDPEGPGIARQNYVLNTGTGTGGTAIRMPPPPLLPRVIFAQPEYPDFPYAAFVRPSVMSPALIDNIACKDAGRR